MSAIADAYLIAVESVADLLSRAEVAERWEAPSALAEWSVAGLAGHLAGQAIHTGDRLREEPGSDPIPLDEHYHRVTWIGAEVGDEQSVDIREGGQRTAAEGVDALVGQVRQARVQLPELLASTSPDRPVLIPWQGWSVRRDDFLTTRMMEITVHSDDLAASVGLNAPELPDEVLRPVLSLLTRLAMRRHGQSAVVAALARAERAPDRINAF